MTGAKTVGGSASYISHFPLPPLSALFAVVKFCRTNSSGHFHLSSRWRALSRTTNDLFVSPFRRGLLVSAHDAILALPVSLNRSSGWSWLGGGGPKRKQS